jgi:guanylate kinase
MGPLIVLSGPSGSGKSTVIRRLLQEAAVPLRLSVSVTTRPKRAQETEDEDYHFWDRERFQRELAADGFLEWADVFGNYYGTLKREVEPFRRQGMGVILDIDVKGWEQVRGTCPDAVSIFLRTSSLQVLEERLRRRKTESEESLQRRLQGARAELARAGEYSHQVVNDELETVVKEVRTLVESAYAKTKEPVV